MVDAAGFGRHCGAAELFDRLSDVYARLAEGSSPSRGTADVAAVLYAGVRGQQSCVCSVSASPRDCSAQWAEVTCVSETLLDKMVSRLLARSLPAESCSYWEEVLRVLSADMKLMDQLVHQFRSADQIVSHLAAKSASACVFYDLLKSGMVSAVWQERCTHAFHNSHPGAELDAFMWSLNEVLKKLVIGAHGELLQKLLAAFDCSLCALCLKFLPEEEKEASQCLEERSPSTSWGTTFGLLLDLLEVLSASGGICGSELSFKSQKLICVYASGLLTAVGCSSSQYFVRRKVMLLLKRVVLQRVGEDWAPGEVLSTRLKSWSPSCDQSPLAQSVLKAVDRGWLHRIEVETASYFGGTVPLSDNVDHKPDCVMLRAVSLTLLKSVELHTQTESVDDGAAADGYLQSLWTFLRRCHVQFAEMSHQCCWISVLFGEQDDDMIEAARVTLSIFLNQRRRCALKDLAGLEATCSVGCNPHCHFVLLVQSISFDHSILLDFLISTETCFLEYFVRYLKYLKSDWQGFSAACTRTRGSTSGLSHPPGVSRRSEKHSRETRRDPARLRSDINPTSSKLPVKNVISPAQLRLVDYDSSDESDPEGMEVCEVTPGSPVCRSSPSNNEADGTPVWSEPAPPSPLGGPAPPSDLLTREVLKQTSACLRQLSEVVKRLHAKKLFPYNPTSLLKLLAQVNSCHLEAHQSPCCKP